MACISARNSRGSTNHASLAHHVHPCTAHLLCLTPEAEQPPPPVCTQLRFHLHHHSPVIISEVRVQVLPCAVLRPQCPPPSTTPPPPFAPTLLLMHGPHPTQPAHIPQPIPQHKLRTQPSTCTPAHAPKHRPARIPAHMPVQASHVRVRTSSTQGEPVHCNTVRSTCLGLCTHPDRGPARAAARAATATPPQSPPAPPAPPCTQRTPRPQTARPTSAAPTRVQRQW